MSTITDTHPKLGDYVVTERHGHRGRVTAVHHSCTGGAAWLSVQSDLTDDERKGRGVWLSVLVHGGGAVEVPARDARRVDPFPFENIWAGFYFDLDETPEGV